MLPYLKSGDVVRLREAGQWKGKAEVIDQVVPRSYRLRTEAGSVCRRNRQQILLAAGDPKSEPEFAPSETNQSDGSPSDLRRRGRVVGRPKWMTDYVMWKTVVRFSA